MPQKIRVLTYNIHKGFTRDNRSYVLEHIRNAIRRTNADLVALQEVQGEHKERAKQVDDWHPEGHFEYLADSVWQHTAYGKNAIYEAGHHGNALLSKYAFQHLKNDDISLTRYSRRSILHGKIAPTAATCVHAACIHMGFMPLEQYRQTRKLQDWLAAIPDDAPLVLMGDFNDWHLRIHRSLSQRNNLEEAVTRFYGKLQPTYPSHRPRMPLDRIYFRNLEISHCEVCHGEPWADLSDHCPILADLEF